MIGTSLPFGRGGGHGGEQFYDPYGEGRHSNYSRRPRNGFSQAKYHHHGNSNSSNNGNNKQQQVVEEDGCCRRVASASSSSLVSVSASGRKMTSCNLDRFLESTTPMVPLQYLSKTITKGFRASEAEFMPFFSLGDLWESFNEWSAYGAGVPIVLNGSDTVVQYYVPSLSAIQLWRPGDESDISDEGSSDGEVERDLNYGGLMHRRNSKGFNCASQGGFSSDDGEASDCLCFQYFERAVPYSREPLADKIASLARSFPKLNTLRSIDLLSSSWLSVAWYPIYRIPTGPTLQDLAACFLTFHSLSTPLKDGSNSHIRVGERSVPCNHIIKSGGSSKLALSVFGLASYKFQGTVWSSTGSSCKRQRPDSLLQTADEWLRSRHVEHPDYEFFLSHGSSYRG